MKTTESKYWHDVEEVAEEFVEYRERLQEEDDEDIKEKLEEFLDNSIEDSDWFYNGEFLKVLQFTRSLQDHKAFSDEFLAKDCMKEDIGMIIESFNEIEYEEISEDDSLDLMEIDFDL